MIEVWNPVEGQPGYSVSDLGNLNQQGYEQAKNQLVAG